MHRENTHTNTHLIIIFLGLIFLRSVVDAFHFLKIFRINCHILSNKKIIDGYMIQPRLVPVSLVGFQCSIQYFSNEKGKFKCFMYFVIKNASTHWKVQKKNPTVHCANSSFVQFCWKLKLCVISVREKHSILSLAFCSIINNVFDIPNDGYGIRLKKWSLTFCSSDLKADAWM